MSAKKKENITINHIAEKLNVSVSTVSRALNNHPKISEKTKTAVLMVAAEIGYQPNLPEAFKPANAPKVVGVIVPHFDKSIYSSALNGISEILESNGFNALVSVSNNNSKRELELLESFEAMQVNGLIISASTDLDNTEKLISLHKKGIKVVGFNRVSPDLPTGKIILDNFHGAFIATEHLLSSGCKRIAHLSGDSKCPIYSERVNGYLEALKANNIELDNKLLIYSEQTQEDVTNFLEYVFSLADPPDGLLLNNNLLALQCFTYLKNSGLNVPEDVAIITYGSESFNQYLSLAFSSIEYSALSMGQKAAKLLINEINEPEKQGDITLVESSRLIIRNSSLRQ